MSSDELGDIRLAVNEELSEITLIVKKINAELAELASQTDSFSTIQSNIKKIKELQALTCPISESEEEQNTGGEEGEGNQQETGKNN